MVRSTSLLACWSSRWWCAGTSGSPMICSRSRTGGGPPSGASAVKKRLTEKVEQGGEAARSCLLPPPRSGWLSIISASRPPWRRKAEIPSGRWKGPENSKSTVRDTCAGSAASGANDGIARRSGNGSDGGRRVGPPRVGVLIEVDVRGEHYTWDGRNVDVVCTRSGQAAAQIDAYPCARLHTGLRVGRPRLHSESSAPERHNGHNPRLDARERFIRRDGALWRSSCAIQYVHSVGHSVCSEGGRCSAGHQIGACQFHDTANRALGYAVQLMDVGRTGGGVSFFACKEFGELLGQEFTGVVAVNCTDDGRWCVLPGIVEGRKAGKKPSYV
eukprot:6187945-Pleurochrysis_carterae.AAC.2